MDESVNDQELYEGALSAETPEAPQAETPEQESPERPRDEKGRFAAKEQPEETEPEVTAEPEPAMAVEEKPDHRIPLTELLNEREKRQNEQRRAEALAREIEQLRQQLQPQRPPQVPDQFQDPEGYNAFWKSQLDAVRQEYQTSLRDMRAELSLQSAHREHKELFEQGYQAVMDRAAQGDKSVAQMVANSPNPGEAIVNWYRREQTLKEVGTDPKAYAEKILEQALSNPEFIAKAIEKAKAQASTQPTQVKLPPSLNKATASRGDTDNDTSDAGMYRHATGR